MSIAKYKYLLKSFGFQAFLWTQFLGAFNDNVFKIVLSMIAVNMAAGEHGGGYVSLVGAIFILPFFLFSGYAGFLADAFNKRTVLITTKSLEIFAAAFGLFAFLSGNIEFMLFTLFLMALHSTFFSPAKYGIIPEILPKTELSRANGLLEMSTFLAIILGSSIGTIMYSYFKDDLSYIGVFLITVALAGTAMSFGISGVASPAGRNSFKVNPWSEIAIGFRRLIDNRLLLMTVTGITYFWFLGSLLQMDMLLLGKEVMGLTDLWVGILITFLAVGIGIGSITAGRLSGDKIEPGLIPLGSIGMGLFSILLATSSGSYPRTASALIMIGFFGGFFIVPLNAILQQKSDPAEKGRIIATNNFINTGGILLASITLWALNDLLSIPADRIILIFGIITLITTVFVLRAFPDFFVRFILWLLTHTFYRIRIAGKENVPFRGPALLVSNHLSFVDGLLIGACAQRFIRFMIYKYYCDFKSIGWFLRLMKSIPITDGTNRDVLKSIIKAREELKAGHVVCIFAEGSISRTGNLLPFKKGLEKIVKGLDVPIIPVHLDLVWGSIFSFKGGRFFSKMPAEFPYPVTISFGKPLPPDTAAFNVRQAIMELGSAAAEKRRQADDMLHIKFMRMAKKRLFSFCMADSTGKEVSWAKALTGSLLFASWVKKNRPEEENIAVMLPSTVAGALVNIGIVTAGKIPVNLNFTLGAETISSALDKCGAKTIITSRAFLSKAGIKEMNGMVFAEDIASRFSGLKRLAALFSAIFVPSRVLNAIFSGKKPDPNRLTAIIFTSGSTGVPKGVMLTHHNIVSNIEGLTQIFSTGRKDTLLGVLPFFHSFGFTATLWFPLISGFKAVYHPNPLDSKGVGDMARKYGATILIGTPTFYSGYIKKCPKEDFSTLRYAVTGAEKLRDEVAFAFKEKFGIELMEGYGCTELSPVVSVNIPDVEYEELSQKGFAPGTVGHPIPGVSVKVVDPESLEELGAGEAGLLMVKGPNLMAGYLEDPENTEKVIKDGWYLTGDIAVLSEDGFIRITDRLSRFSKMAGEMIPHLRIEEAISKALGLCDCVVTSLPDAQKGEKIIAFYTKNSAPGDVWEKLLSSGLPRLWIPKRENLHYVEAIPVTATGKVDLRKVKGLASALSGESAGIGVE